MKIVLFPLKVNITNNAYTQLHVWIANAIYKICPRNYIDNYRDIDFQQSSRSYRYYFLNGNDFVLLYRNLLGKQV